MVLFIVVEKIAPVPSSSLEPAEVAIISISGTSTMKRSSNLRAVLRVSSIRVPRCNSMVTLKRALSCCCIKSVPTLPKMNGKSEAPKNANRITIVNALWRKHHANDFPYALSTLSSIATIVRSYHDFFSLLSTNLPLITLKFLDFNSLEQSIGVSVIAITVEVQHTTVTIQPKDLNMIPAIPSIMVNGMNTAQSTRVVAITLTHTSFVA